MSHENGVIRKPDNTDDVVAVIGENSHDIKTLCMSERINMWARFKPEAQGTQKSLTLEARRTNNFGLYPLATYASKTVFVNAVAAGTFTGGWGYTKPGDSAFGRLDDFDGYNHYAVPPFGRVLPFDGILSANQTVHLEIPCEAPPSGDDTIITIDEFQKAGADYSNWYFGILLLHLTKSTVRPMATATTKIGASQQWQIDFGYLTPSVYAGAYRAVPFLSSKPFSVTGAEPSPVTIIGVGSKGATVELKTVSEVYVPFASCYYLSSSTLNVNYLASIQNTGASASTFSNVVLVVAKSDTGRDSMTLVSFGNVTVAAGKTWSQSGVKAVASRDYQFCRLQYTGSSNMAWINFEDLDEEDNWKP